MGCVDIAPLTDDPAVETTNPAGTGSMTTWVMLRSIYCVIKEQKISVSIRMFSSWTTYLAPESSSYMVLGSKGTIHSTPPATAKDDSPIRHFGIVMFGEKEDEPKKLSNPPFEPLDTSDIVLPGTSFFVNEILHFEECIRTQREPLSSGRDNIETMKVVLGILESSRTGKPVDMADL